jgi:hypothetical protein
MGENWRKAFKGLGAVQAFDSVPRGGHQKPDERYNIPGRTGPPTGAPPLHARQYHPQLDQNTFYFNHHPQSPFLADTTQSFTPVVPSSPPQQQLQYSPQSSPPQPQLQYSPQSSPPQQYSSHVPTQSYAQDQSTYGAQHNATPGYYAPNQGSPPPMDNPNVSGQPPQEHHRGFEAGNGGGSGYWNRPETAYDPYNQPRTDSSQRSNTMYAEPRFNPQPGAFYRSSTDPNDRYHNCADNFSQ